MITTREVKINKIDNLTSEYIESQLKQMGFDVLRWAITDTDKNHFVLDVSFIFNKS